MSLINIENLTFGYPDSLSPIFENFNLNIDAEWKIGIIGENGTGKTTLFKLLCGELKGVGKIYANTNFIRYPVNIPDKTLTPSEIATEFLPEYEDWKFFREAGLIGLDEDALARQYALLSGGEQTKFQLALAFAADGYPLIDEPTDHLDAEGRRRLADYLSCKKGFAVVSHDRAFLDGVCSHILALENGKSVLVRGNYSVYAKERDKRLRFDEAERAKLEKERARLAPSAKRINEWGKAAEREKINGSGKRDGKRLSVDKGFLGAKAAKIQKRAGAVTARRAAAEEQLKERLKDFRETENLKLNPEEFFKEELLSLRNISVSLPGKNFFNGLNLSVIRGERVAVSGGNGTGKSTLFKIITGEAEFRGERAVSERLKISYIPQVCAYSGTLEEYAAGYAIDVSYFKALLSKLGFDVSDFLRDMSAFSEGQKKKAALARSLCERAHLYIWDEPLNYLDITAREQLENAVLSSGATLLFTEHDAAFVGRVATRFVKL